MNRRVCLAMRCTGGGLAELQTFCGVMDLTLPVQNTEDYLGCRHNCTKKSMDRAAEAEYALSEVTEDGIS